MSDPVMRRLGIADMEQRLGVSRVTVWKWYRAGKLPRPHYLHGLRRWWEHEVAAWEESATSASGTRKAPPRRIA